MTDGVYMSNLREHFPQFFDQAAEFMYHLVEHVTHRSTVGQGVGKETGARWARAMDNVLPNIWFDEKGDPSNLLKALKTDWRRFKEASFKQFRDSIEWMGIQFGEGGRTQHLCTIVTGNRFEDRTYHSMMWPYMKDQGANVYVLNNIRSIYQRMLETMPRHTTDVTVTADLTHIPKSETLWGKGLRQSGPN